MPPLAIIDPGTSLARRVAGLLGDGAVRIGPGLRPDELKGRLQDAGVEVVVDLDGSAPADVLAACSDAGVRHVVVVSSATVYGAWQDNAVPLAEDAPLRPNPGFAFAAARAEAERQVAEWKDDHPGATATVLRPTVTVGGGEDDLTRALSGLAGLRPREASRPVQFLAEEDLASAVALAAERRLDGAFNVAPDGWVPDETARALAGGPARLPVPERLARPARAVARALGFGRTIPGLDPYVRHPWVVAPDRLRAAGWEPAHTNEEAFVLGTKRPWPELSPKHRQEVALGATVVAVAGVVAGVVALVRRAGRRRAGR